MLYIWPYILFFSFPLLHHYILNLIFPLNSLPNPLRHPNIKQALPRLTTAAPIIAAMLAIIHFNTLIHPFTRADNRHYVFYVFRILLRHPSIKYLAAPIYYLSAYAAITALSGPPDAQPSQVSVAKKAKPRNQQAKAQGNAAVEGNRVSFVLIWLGATALSLITAPLVEPRYFILPWLMWRLHLPSLRPVPQEHSRRRKTSNRRSRSLQAWVKAALYKEHDYRLWVETVWFLAVNCATGYVFLYWGFRWAQEPGRVQRFMW